jgi:hypothetical protein
MPNIAGQSLREVGDLERFYHEAQRIRHDLDLLLRDLAAAIKPTTRASATDPIYTSPITGKRHKIRRAK